MQIKICIFHALNVLKRTFETAHYVEHIFMFCVYFLQWCKDRYFESWMNMTIAEHNFKLINEKNKPW